MTSRRALLLGLAGVTVGAAAGCSLPSAALPDIQVPPEQAGLAQSLRDLGGLEGLEDAAREEGELVLGGVTYRTLGYQQLVREFVKQYKLRVDVTPGLTDLGRPPDAVHLAPAQYWDPPIRLAPYFSDRFARVLPRNKDAGGLWVNDYAGVMTMGYDPALDVSLDDPRSLLAPELKGRVALAGDPVTSGEGQFAVLLMNALRGGASGDVSAGIEFLRELHEAGTLSGELATTGSVRAGRHQVVFGWSYTQLALGGAMRASGGSWAWQAWEPALLGAYYAQAVVADAPHPAAARLWQEFVFGNVAQNIWLQEGATPVLFSFLSSDGRLETAEVDPPVFPSPPVFPGRDTVLGTARTLAEDSWLTSQRWGA